MIGSAVRACEIGTIALWRPSIGHGCLAAGLAAAEGPRVRAGEGP